MKQLHFFPIRIFFNEWTGNITEPLCIVWKQMDPMKDIIMLSRMVVLLGGLKIVFTNPQLFSSCVSDLIRT